MVAFHKRPHLMAPNRLGSYYNRPQTQKRAVDTKTKNASCRYIANKTDRHVGGPKTKARYTVAHLVANPG